MWRDKPAKPDNGDDSDDHDEGDESLLKMTMIDDDSESAMVQRSHVKG